VLFSWLLGTFEGLNFNLFLAVFSAIFPHSDSLFHIVQSKISDILFCTEKSDTHLEKKILSSMGRNFEDDANFLRSQKKQVGTDGG